MSAARLVWVYIACLVLAGCSFREQVQCVSNPDCPAGLECYQGICARPSGSSMSPSPGNGGGGRGGNPDRGGNGGTGQAGSDEPPAASGGNDAPSSGRGGDATGGTAGEDPPPPEAGEGGSGGPPPNPGTGGMDASMPPIDAGPIDSGPPPVPGECTAGETRPCTVPAISAPLLGGCGPGTQTCEADLGDAWGLCIPDNQRTDETCNGVDDDCDSRVDETRVECYPNDAVGCTAMPDGRYACQGTCKAGARVCQGDALGDCTGSVVPAAETCANPNEDNDCNNAYDDVPNLNMACNVTGGVGICQAGALQCAAGSTEPAPRCVATIRPGDRPEACDNRRTDEDCDGQLDEGFNLMTDAMNCGMCGNACTSDQACCGGTCVSKNLDTSCGGCMACPGSQICCGMACVDPTSDDANCGACGTTGPTHVCAAGSKCCSSACVDLTAPNPAHCGACSTACTDPAVCMCAPPSGGTTPVCGCM
ncbi:MAG: hypothetical protein ABW321_01800 [Polyangiales bacterium]